MRLPLLVLLVACARGPGTVDGDGDGEDPPADPPTDDPEGGDPVRIRVATFNLSFFGDDPDDVATRLQDPDWAPAVTAATILQEVRPDVVLFNELDHPASGPLLDRFLSFLAVGRGDREPLTFTASVVPPVNTGVPTGLDLDGDGVSDHPEGTPGHAADAHGFGLFPGQYGLAVASRFPLGAEGGAPVRTFQTLLWQDMPDALLPTEHYGAEAAAALRLSSKTHADVPVQLDGGRVLHLLVSHPTPPTFDGPEDRNGRRNHDEIRFWKDYVDAGPDGWMVDDAGAKGGLGDGAAFVILGDLNADPHDGDSRSGAIAQLLDHPRIQDPEPSSDGAAEQARLQGGANDAHRGPARQDTADFEDGGVGNLRLDYVLPSADLEVLDAGVFWPTADDPRFPLVGTFPFPQTDHRLVWVDLRVR